MLHSKWLISFFALGVVASHVAAGSQRTVFTVENQFLRREQLEVGADVRYNKQDVPFDSLEFREFAPFFRYGLREHIAVHASVPFVHLSSDSRFGPSESGLGDIKMGLQLLAHQDIFGYPYFIPHVSVKLPTGDEDKGLGAGGATWEVGISYGDKMYDFVSWVMDLGYRVNQDFDNQFLFSMSFLWHVSEELDFVFEGRYESDSGINNDKSLILGLAGMVYDWTETLQMGVHVGTGLSGDTEALAQFRVSYRF